MMAEEAHEAHTRDAADGRDAADEKAADKADKADKADGAGVGEETARDGLMEFPLTPEQEAEGIRRLQQDADALRRLHSENVLLKRTLVQMQERMKRGGGAVLEAGEAEAGGDQALRDTLGSLIDLRSPDGTESFYEQLKKHVDSPAFLATLEENQAVVVGNADSNEEVGVVDLDNVEWWTLVPSPDKPGQNVEECSLSGPYVFVEQHDVIEAIGEFVALYMARMPAAQQLSPEDLQGLLSGTFSEFKEKGVFDNMWSWGRFLYASYGWGMTGLSLYRDPSMALYVMRALWTATKWAGLVAIV